jgi:hypothetical protein
MPFLIATPAGWSGGSLRASIVEGPSASVWRIGRGVAQLQASTPRSGEAAHGAVPSPQAPAWGTRRVLLGGTKNRRYCGGPASPFAGGPARHLIGREPARRPLGGRHFRGNENKPLTAISNRNSNDSRKVATASESTTSNFLIATKMHLSEEKAKREEKAKLILTGDAHKPGMCASATARLASEHSRGTLSGRCNVTPDFSVDFAGTGRASICPCRTGSN